MINWFLRKSSDFREFLNDFREHEKKTKSSFKNVKRDNLLIVKKLKEHEKEIKKLNRLLEQERIKVYRKIR